MANAAVSARRRPPTPRGLLAQAVERAEKIEADAKAHATAWSLPQTIVHCAQSIEYSIAGFPRGRSRIFQAVLGRAVKRRFLRRGVMFHNRAAPIPGAPAIPSSVTRAEVFERLKRAVADFQAHSGTLAPHFRLRTRDQGRVRGASRDAPGRPPERVRGDARGLRPTEHDSAPAVRLLQPSVREEHRLSVAGPKLSPDLS